MAISNKIKEILLEPSTIFIKDKIKIKVKCIRYVTCKELSGYTCEKVANYTCKDLKGE